MFVEPAPLPGEPRVHRHLHPVSELVAAVRRGIDEVLRPRQRRERLAESGLEPGGSDG